MTKKLCGELKNIVGIFRQLYELKDVEIIETHEILALFMIIFNVLHYIL